MATVTRENIGTLHDKITVKLVKDDYMPAFEKTLKQYATLGNVRKAGISVCSGGIIGLGEKDEDR